MNDGIPIDGQVIQHYQTNTLPPKWKVLGKHKLKPTFSSMNKRNFPTPGPKKKCHLGAEPISERCPPLPVLKKVANSVVHQPLSANKLMKKTIQRFQRFMRINIQRLRYEKQQKQHKK